MWLPCPALPALPRPVLRFWHTLLPGQPSNILTRPPCHALPRTSPAYRGRQRGGSGENAAQPCLRLPEILGHHLQGRTSKQRKQGLGHPQERERGKQPWRGHNTTPARAGSRMAAEPAGRGFAGGCTTPFCCHHGADLRAIDDKAAGTGQRRGGARQHRLASACGTLVGKI